MAIALEHQHFPRPLPPETLQEGAELGEDHIDADDPLKATAAGITHRLVERDREDTGIVIPLVDRAPDRSVGLDRLAVPRFFPCRADRFNYPQWLTAPPAGADRKDQLAVGGQPLPHLVDQQATVIKTLHTQVVAGLVAVVDVTDREEADLFKEQPFEG